MASIEFNWNVFPSTKTDEKNMVTPLGCIVSPFHNSEVPLSTSEPIACSLCGSYINPHIRVDRDNHSWWCPMCSKISSLPSSFEIHDKDSPNLKIAVEITPSSSNTIDYVLPSDITSSKSLDNDFILTYVIDLYQNIDSLALQEIDSLLLTVAGSIAKLPENTQILLITFSDCVQIHQPGINKSVSVLPKDMKKENVPWSEAFEDIHFFDNLIKRLCQNGGINENDKLNLSHFKALLAPSEMLASYIRDLKPRFTRDVKPNRSTGLASLIAVSLCTKFARPNSQGKLMLFLGGPATLSPGKIVSKKENIRSHNDVANFRAPHFLSASKFYRTLSYMTVGYSPKEAYTSVYSSTGKLVDFAVSENSPKFSIDIYTGSLDQVGVYEMKAMVEAGGGNIFMAENFASTDLQNSYDQNLRVLLNANHICKLTVIPSPSLKVMKILANCTELQSSFQSEKFSSLHHEKISDTITSFDSSLKKRNITNQWFLGSVSCNDSLALFFEMNTASSSSKKPENSRGKGEAVIQLQFKYWSMSKCTMMLRVVTIKRPTTLSLLTSKQATISAEQTEILNLSVQVAKELKWLEGFCGRVWIVLLTRLLISKIDTAIGFENFESIVNQVDDSIIKLLSRNGGVRKKSKSFENPFTKLTQTSILSERFSHLPALAYDLRQNLQLMNIFNCSPDETAYHHLNFLRCNSVLSCKMISPALYRVTGNQLLDVPLDRQSLTYLLFFILDCLDLILIYNHFTCAQDELPLHPSLNDLKVLGNSCTRFLEILELVNEFLLHERPFHPKIITSQSGHSQARYLFSRMAASSSSDDSPPNVESKWLKYFTDLMLTRKRISATASFDEYCEEILERVQNLSI
ncbi:vWA-like protein [Metschnikowia bicuspidata var. bicuspidata NRRL YB-4993]|uniref:Protein transport protein SEC23 n=1 Tax=Metschnikowia bicuspidata var. bicuspidata NRRL YB-4993 TaxID=869754 RepID=A0A1A0H8T3_9ASCO|nr:vWA-like protein [Metschnikowia bicuspidata var. bicuspidata NRRL YB-4993]OBA20529.1 vWA-like protein [Metschnikowia bicuspidata var. bicuspidata NRRL YB-4993]